MLVILHFVEGANVGRFFFGFGSVVIVVACGKPDERNGENVQVHTRL